MEQAYYEQDSLWLADRYLQDQEEVQRYSLLADMVPDRVTSLLDVGAGNGALLLHLERRGRPAKLAGIERSKAAIARAVCRTPITPGDAASLPYPDRSMGVVSACEVLEHLPHEVYRRVLAEMARVADTHVLISVPYRERREFFACPECQSEFPQYLHLRTFDEARLQDLLAGFSLASLQKAFRTEQPKLPHPVALYRRFRRLRRPMAPGAMCPVCGYFASSNPLPAAGPSRGGLRGLYQRLLPFRKVPRWAIALYRRDH